MFYKGDTHSLLNTHPWRIACSDAINGRLVGGIGAPSGEPRNDSLRLRPFHSLLSQKEGMRKRGSGFPASLPIPDFVPLWREVDKRSYAMAGRRKRKKMILDKK